MDGNDKKWLISLIATVIVAPLFFAFIQYEIIPIYFENKPQLSYTVEAPLRIFDENTNYNANIKINNISLSRLYGQPVRVWNSGKEAIENLNINYSFKETLDKNFNIFAVIHNTSPQNGFGLVSSGGNDNSREYSYRLLNPAEGSNPADEFTVLFLIDKIYPIEVIPRKAGLTDIRQIPAVSPTNERSLFDTIRSFLWLILSIIIIILVLIFGRSFIRNHNN